MQLMQSTPCVKYVRDIVETAEFKRDLPGELEKGVQVI